MEEKAASAPQLRTGVGTSQVELLNMASAFEIEGQGQQFPAVEHEGMLLPEVCESRPGFLPHLHDDQESRYPRAVVEHELGDREPAEDDSFERRRVALGQHKLRPVPQSSSTGRSCPPPTACSETGRSTAYKACKNKVENGDQRPRRIKFVK